MNCGHTVLALAMLAAFTQASAQATSTAAVAPASSQAQAIVDRLARDFPELLEIDLHAMSPTTGRSEIVAARSAARIGNPTDPDDAAVIKTGEPFVEVNSRGDQNVEVHLALYDARRRIVCMLELTFPLPGRFRLRQGRADQARRAHPRFAGAVDWRSPASRRRPPRTRPASRRSRAPTR